MTEPVYLFNLLGQQRSWLGARQSYVAQNIANANTPGYRSVDTVPFSKILENSLISMTGDHPGHLRTPANMPQSSSGKDGSGWEIAHSGNNVTLEQEIAKSGEVRRMYSLDTAIQKTFHSMWLTSIKG